MQKLLDRVSNLPGLLQKLDILTAQVHTSSPDDFQHLFDDMHHQISSLLQFAPEVNKHFGSDHLWWPVAASSWSSSENRETMEDAAFPIAYHFPNILTANLMCHYWVSLIVAYISSETLTNMAEQHGIQLQGPAEQICEVSRRKVEDLADDICKSMAYHVQPEMKLYGPAATLFPVKIASQVIKRGIVTKDIVWCRQFVEQWEDIGIGLARYVPGVE